MNELTSRLGALGMAQCRYRAAGRQPGCRTVAVCTSAFLFLRAVGADFLPNLGLVTS